MEWLVRYNPDGTYACGVTNCASYIQSWKQKRTVHNHLANHHSELAKIGFLEFVQDGSISWKITENFESDWKHFSCSRIV